MIRSQKPSARLPRNVATIVPDATALKALAHPMRLRMLGLLRIEGPANATHLASRLGLNTGAASYHLRQLALHGFIEDEPAPSRRERWWRAAHEATRFLDTDAAEDALDAGVAFSQAALSWQVSQMQSAIERHASLEPEWRAVSTVNDYTIPLTAGQAKALVDKLQSILWDAMKSAPPLGGDLPEGTKPYTIILHGFPYSGAAPGEEET